MPIPDSFPIAPWTLPDPVVAGSTPIRAVHINEIRANINLIPTKPQIEALIGSTPTGKYFVSQTWEFITYGANSSDNPNGATFAVEFFPVGSTIGLVGMNNSGAVAEIHLTSLAWSGSGETYHVKFYQNGNTSGDVIIQVCVFGIRNSQLTLPPYLVYHGGFINQNFPPGGSPGVGYLNTNSYPL